MPASNQQTTLRDCGYPQVGCYTLHGSLTSPYKAGFLTSGSSLAFPFSYYVQWDNEGSLLCYSDRIAQDLHLIPSSDCYADNNLHFICSIWNYTDIIITRCQFAVNNLHNICQIFIILCILENSLFCYCFSAFHIGNFVESIHQICYCSLRSQQHCFFSAYVLY